MNKSLLRQLAPYAVLLLGSAALPATAQEDGAALVSKSLCYACHQMSDASIGPPWQAIATRHAPRKDVMRDVLVSRVLRGGGGNWGLVPMVPNQRVSEAEARIMVEWILAQAPQ
jgi:cytochrome c551/c552